MSEYNDLLKEQIGASVFGIAFRIMYRCIVHLVFSRHIFFVNCFNA